MAANADLRPFQSNARFPKGRLGGANLGRRFVAGDVVAHLCYKPGRLPAGLLARGRDHDFNLILATRCRAENLKVEVDLFNRERDVLVRLGLDLNLHVGLAQPCRENDLFCDHCARRQRHGDTSGGGGQPLPSTTHSVCDHIKLSNIPVAYRIAGQGFNRITLQPSLTAVDVGQLDQLDG